ncbi:hypothetical protein EJB05_04558, partial [Eragrostis curvula]
MAIGERAIMLNWFVRSLFQGFRKVDPDRWEFANEGFLRGKRDLLKTIKRRRPPTSPSSSSPAQQGQPQAQALEVGQFGREGEVHRLQRDKGILLAEVVKLRHEQQATRAQMQAMEERITAAEQKQQQMTVFLARAMKNPGFLKMLVDRQGGRKVLEDELSKKRRRPPIEYFPETAARPEPPATRHRRRTTFLDSRSACRKRTRGGGRRAPAARTRRASGWICSTSAWRRSTGKEEAPATAGRRGAALTWTTTWTSWCRASTT